MEFTSLNEGDDFLAYPTNKVVGVVSTPRQLTAAIAELNGAGFGEKQVQVLCGPQGAERLDITGEHHGLLARLYRFLEKFGDMESKNLKEYRDELLGGHFLVAVDAAEEEQRTRVSEILKSHGGHRINFYGRWAVEGLAS